MSDEFLSSIDTKPVLVLYQQTRDTNVGPLRRSKGAAKFNKPSVWRWMRKMLLGGNVIIGLGLVEYLSESQTLALN